MQQKKMVKNQEYNKCEFWNGPSVDNPCTFVIKPGLGARFYCGKPGIVQNEEDRWFCFRHRDKVKR